ncbi:hypothetical protein JCM15765_19080 [Paradesulfitobacterium aromaticivorans]
MCTSTEKLTPPGHNVSCFDVHPLVLRIKDKVYRPLQANYTIFQKELQLLAKNIYCNYNR